MKMRTNLDPVKFPDMPRVTYSLDLSELTLSLDEQIYKDAAHLVKFFAWHNNSAKKPPGQSYLKFRPAYNLPVRGNTKAFWQYAIKSTLYLL